MTFKGRNTSQVRKREQQSCNKQTKPIQSRQAHFLNCTPQQFMLIACRAIICQERAGHTRNVNYISNDIAHSFCVLALLLSENTKNIW